MEQAAVWRDFKARFEALIPDAEVVDGVGLFVRGNELFGGPQDDVRRASVENRFRNHATRAGIEAGGTKNTGFETWLKLLREKLQPVNNLYFPTDTRSYRASSKPMQYQDISVSRIDYLDDRKPGVSDEIQREANILDRLIESIKRDGVREPLLVEPGDDDRYVAIPRQLLVHAASVLKQETLCCAVREPGSGEDEPRVIITQPCRASADLCDLLETEAFASQETVTKVKPEDSKPSARRRSGHPRRRGSSLKARQQAMSIKRMAKLVDVSQDTIRRAIKREEIKTFRVGRQYRISLSEIKRYRSQRDRI